MIKKLANNLINAFRHYNDGKFVMLRRVGIGCLLGFIVIVLIQSLPSSTPSTTIARDQKFSLANLFSSPKEEAIEPVIRKTTAYDQFDLNKASLSEQQIDAIQNDKPRISLVIQGLGENETTLSSVQDTFTAPITVTLSPYTPSFTTIAQQLSQKGYEVWLDLKTMTASNMADNGPDALDPTRDFETNISLVERQMGQISDYTGVSITPDSVMPRTDATWKKITTDLFAQGYGVFDTTSTILAPDFYYYNNMAAPYIRNDIYINADTPLESFKAQLATITKQIQTDKTLVLTTTIHTPTTLDILAEWVDSLVADGVTIIPLSSQAKL